MQITSTVACNSATHHRPTCGNRCTSCPGLPYHVSFIKPGGQLAEVVVYVCPCADLDSLPLPESIGGLLIQPL